MVWPKNFKFFATNALKLGLLISKKGSKIMILGSFLQKKENFLKQELKIRKNFEKYDFYHNNFFKYQSYSKFNADSNAKTRF